jgi:hypothetical protein
VKIKDYEYYFFVWLIDEIGDWLQRRRKRSYARTWWHRWYAWRPIRIPEAKYDDIVVPAHYVWLEHVDTRKVGWNWYNYRPNTLEGDVYQRIEKKVVNGEWAEQLVTKTLDQLQITTYESTWDGGW